MDASRATIHILEVEIRGGVRFSLRGRGEEGECRDHTHHGDYDKRMLLTDPRHLPDTLPQGPYGAMGKPGITSPLTSVDLQSASANVT